MNNVNLNMKRIRKFKYPVITLFLFSFILVFVHSEFGRPENGENHHFEHDYNKLITKSAFSEENSFGNNPEKYFSADCFFNTSEYHILHTAYQQVFLYSLDRISMKTLFKALFQELII